MCDTLVITAESAVKGRAIFAKNSDREPSEAQLLELVPARSWPEGSRLFATYAGVPQVSQTHRVLLSRPYWMWGAEMGLNEHGVAIGNEAVFTRAPLQARGLLGMDLVRLGLERSSSADQAVDIMTALLSEHGQGGPAGHRDKSFRYDSSFIVADTETAWVLETAGRLWAAKRVRGVRAISNALSLRDDWDIAADGLATTARDWGLAPGCGKVDFAATFGKAWMGYAANAPTRRGCVEEQLRSQHGSIDVEAVLRVLRQHGVPDRPGRVGTAVRATVCGHAAPWPTRAASQTTGSMVADLTDRPVAYVTGTSAPCLSLFRPIWVDVEDADASPAPSERYDPRCSWWAHERLHRRGLRQLDANLVRLSEERDAIERRLVQRARSAHSSAERQAVCRQGASEAREFRSRWDDRLTGPGRLPPLLRRYWRGLDRESGLAQVLEAGGFRY